ncbi:ADP-ribosylation factor GTPase-activating protein AGD3 [Capsicum chinense]|nr:ADP-ribosylation factor GTPase-activating protein AGD3 [Capsicum chinense]
MDWIEKITGVIASLLSSQAPDRCLPASPMESGHHRSASESSSFESSDFDPPAVEDHPSDRLTSTHHDRPFRNSQHLRSAPKTEQPIGTLRRVCGNDKCADCGAAEPDWASLNLGVLVCIECSGVHRNLGVHISKVRSLTLDVKVWEPSVIALFQSLGNTFANSVWEESLQARGAFHVNVSAARLVSCSTHFLSEVHLHLSDIIWPLETEAHTDLINSTSSISASQVMLIPFQPRRNSSMQSMQINHLFVGPRTVILLHK